MNAIRLEMSQASVSIGRRRILDNISLSLPAGSMTVLIGPNGSGKTTLIRVLAGILRPQSGSVRCGSIDLRTASRTTIARHCAYLPQGTETDFEIRVEDAVAMGRYPHRSAWSGMQPADYDAVNWAIERSGLAGLRDRTLPTLSGGERQRVFIARALAQQAPVLLLDEPIASLDIGRQIELMALLQQLNAEGRTVLCALHDLRPALDFFPRALLLAGGRLVASGSTTEVIFGPEIESAFGVQVRRDQQLCFRQAAPRG
jgi:ABC-type cobalamin/Fe3+-siderophores transport system ATPase subunit